MIIPFVNEWPQLIFTIASVYEDLRGRADFEIIAVDNWCKEMEHQGKKRDACYNYLKEVEKGQKWLKVIQYQDKLSHWQCKNAGVSHSSGDFLWFCDAHCVVSRNALFNQYVSYQVNHDMLDGTLHLPLTYSILEWRSLIYKLMADLEKGSVHYSFSSYRPASHPYRVPCMSTCGMMITRELFDVLGGWPTELGIYGGGENFINFSLAVLGKSVFIYPGPPLRHYGYRREYHWYHDDMLRNRTIATYIFGGSEFAGRFIANGRGSEEIRRKILEDVLWKCASHRELIRNQQELSIEEWVKQWQA